MTRVRVTSVRWAPVIGAAIAMVAGCDSSQSSGPATEAESALRLSANSVGQSALFIGNFIPGGTTNGPRVIAFKSTITVCHRPPGNPNESSTLTIGYLVGREHVVGHGDTVGSCPAT